MKVSLVGAGPGDPGLFTIKGRALLEEAEVVVYDALANPSLLDFAPATAERIYVGKVADKHALPQSQINELLAQKAHEGKNVVRLKGGDPYIFGRGGEEVEYLQAANIPFEEVPGISSAIAAPAYAGIPLTHRDFTSSVVIATGHENPEKNASSLNWQALAQSGSTLVFVMGMKNLPQIAKNLIAAGLDAQTPAAVIYRGTTPMQRSLAAPLADLPQAARKAGFENPAVIVIGKVVSLKSALDWFSQKPLLGKTIIITRAREQASDMARALAQLGANVYQCPGIKIQALPDYSALDAAVDSVVEYAWVIFTSVNGVKYFWDRLNKAGKDTRSLASCRVAAIGPATAKALAEKGIQPDLVPATYVAESVAAELTALENLAGAHILLPRAAKAREVLPDELAKAGAIVDVVPAYETRLATECHADVLSLIENGKVDSIAFGSSSTVENFFQIIPADLLKKRPEIALAAIGPITAQTIVSHGLKVAIEPEQFTIPALIDAIAEYFHKG